MQKSSSFEDSLANKEYNVDESSNDIESNQDTKEMSFTLNGTRYTLSKEDIDDLNLVADKLAKEIESSKKEILYERFNSLIFDNIIVDLAYLVGFICILISFKRLGDFTHTFIFFYAICGVGLSLIVGAIMCIFFIKLDIKEFIKLSAIVVGVYSIFMLFLHYKICNIMNIITSQKGFIRSFICGVLFVVSLFVLSCSVVYSLLKLDSISYENLLLFLFDNNFVFNTFILSFISTLLFHLLIHLTFMRYVSNAKILNIKQ